MSRFQRIQRTIQLSFLVVALAILASCISGEGDEELRAQALARYWTLAASSPELFPWSPGMQLYRDHNCHTCHGDNGIKSLLPEYPVLARQSEGYALKQMMEIKSGERANGQAAVMKVIIDLVSDEDIAELATVIATELGGDRPIGGVGVDPESAGAKLFKTKTCTACHGKDAVSPLLPTYPKIAGHKAEYLTRQMLDIKSGTRAVGMAVAGMKGIMHLVTAEEIAELAEYIESLPR